MKTQLCLFVVIFLITLQPLFSQKVGAGYQVSWNKEIKQDLFLVSYTDGPIWFHAGCLNFLSQEKRYYSCFMGAELDLFDVFLRKETIFAFKIGNNIILKKSDSQIFFYSSIGIDITYLNVDFVILTSNYGSTGEYAYRFTNRPSFGLKVTAFVPVGGKKYSEPFY